MMFPITRVTLSLSLSHVVCSFVFHVLQDVVRISSEVCGRVYSRVARHFERAPRARASKRAAPAHVSLIGRIRVSPIGPCYHARLSRRRSFCIWFLCENEIVSPHLSFIFIFYFHFVFCAPKDCSLAIGIVDTVSFLVTPVVPFHSTPTHPFTLCLNVSLPFLIIYFTYFIRSFSSSIFVPIRAISFRSECECSL